MLDLTILHARETAEPEGRARLDWKLATDLPVATPDEAVGMVRWYACRRKIELFHKVLKSGCRAEAARLRTAERLTKLIAVLCVVAWRCFWTTMVARTHDPSSGTTVMWRGWARLADIMLGMELATRLMGNRKPRRRDTNR